MSDQELKSTVLAGEHVALGAKMVPFAGWNMPVQYKEGILAEHEHTRTQASLFDICHMGEFKVFGPGATLALDRILARPVYDQSYGTCRYNFLLNEDGRVIDDLIVYYMGEDDYFIVVNASRIEADAAQIQKYLPEEVTFVNISNETAKLDLQGPASAAVMAKITGLAESALPKYFHWGRAEIDGVPVLFSRTGYTGELGFELYFSADQAVKLWRYLLAQELVKPAGLGARDTLRLELGMALYGHEMNLETTPIEAGMGGMLKLKDNPDRQFVGRDALEKNPGERQLIAIYVEGRRAAREGSEVLDSQENLLGVVTSGGFAPSLGHAVAMAYVKKGNRVLEGDQVLLRVGKNLLPGTIGALPFYKNGTARKKI